MGNTLNILENVDNQIRKNNIRIEGFIEGVEGSNLIAFLEELFTSCLGSDPDVTNHLRYVGRRKTGPIDILVGFSDWSIKSAIFDTLWEKFKIMVEGQEIS